MAFESCGLIWPEAEGTARGAILKSALWPKGSIIDISFLDGEKSLQDRVKKVAQQWIDRTGANLTFSWLNDPKAGVIRISFVRGGSNSVLGRFAKQVTDKSKPTMKYGWLTPKSRNKEVQEVVLHEFGHALGFIHEHQHPGGNIPWDVDEVIKYYKKHYGWDEAKTRYNVLRSYNPRELITNQFDPDSIMLYPIPKKLTTDGSSTSNNTKLSPSDIQLARDTYA